MKPIERGEILGLADYEAVREHFRARVIAEKRTRRVVLDKASALFENRDTVLLQIQEMLRTERITRAAAVDHEIETYNELLPADGELSCTLMIEIADKDERDAFLRAAVGLEKHVWLACGAARTAASASQRFGAASAERTTAVHYLKFSLPHEIADALRRAAAGKPLAEPIELVIDHPAYDARAAFSPAMAAALGEDLLA